jgi:hypothetical protein
MKSISGVLLAVLLLTVAHAETYRGFENRSAGFAIAYPMNWTATENAARTSVQLSESARPGSSGASFVVSVSNASASVKLDDYDRLIPRLFQYLFEDYKQHLKEPTTLAGVNARMLLFEARFGKFPVVGFMKYAIHNGRVYTAMFFSLRQDYDRFRQVGGNILGTFRFL